MRLQLAILIAWSIGRVSKAFIHLPANERPLFQSLFPNTDPQNRVMQTAKREWLRHGCRIYRARELWPTSTLPCPPERPLLGG